MNQNESSKKIVYFDMDGVLVDFQSGIDQLDLHDVIEYKGRYDEVPGIFGTMKPNKDMISLFNAMSLNIGDYLIDDRLANGSEKFGGKLLQYCEGGYTTETLREYFLTN